MKTRVKDFLDTGVDPWAPAYSFQFAEVRKRPSASDWRYPVAGDDGVLAFWRKKEDRDAARACFTTRRSRAAAEADLVRLHLLPELARRNA